MDSEGFTLSYGFWGIQSPDAQDIQDSEIPTRDLGERPQGASEESSRGTYTEASLKALELTQQRTNALLEELIDTIRATR